VKASRATIDYSYTGFQYKQYSKPTVFKPEDQAIFTILPHLLIYLCSKQSILVNMDIVVQSSRMKNLQDFNQSISSGRGHSRPHHDDAKSAEKSSKDTIPIRPFPLKLHTMLEDAESKGFEDIISWCVLMESTRTSQQPVLCWLDVNECFSQTLIGLCSKTGKIAASPSRFTSPTHLSRMS
jgi:hypothetical protein